MTLQYTLSEAISKQTPLFNSIDMHLILTKQWGLRLSNGPETITQDYFIPPVSFSNLGGAKESIHFATLSALILRNPNLDPLIRQQHLQTLSQIFQTFANDSSQQPNLRFVPILILVYATLLNLNTHPIDPKFFERRLPKDEECLLIELFKKNPEPLNPTVVFDKKSDYYGDIPSLRLHLTSDFNQLLEKYLNFNQTFDNNQSQHYLLTTQTLPHEEEILGYMTVQTTHTASIWAWLKEQCAMATLPSTAPVSATHNRALYRNNQIYLAGLLGSGLFSGCASSKSSSPDHQDLVIKTQISLD